MTGQQLLNYGQKKYGEDPLWTKWGLLLRSNYMEFGAVGTSGEQLLGYRVYSEDQLDAFMEDRDEVREEFEAGIKAAQARTNRAAEQDEQERLESQERKAEEILDALIRCPDLRSRFRKVLKEEAEPVTTGGTVAGDLTKNFSSWEFTCRHCGGYGIDRRLVVALQRLRDCYGRPIQIVSGFRCPAHPIEVAKLAIGRGPGTHIEGIAADIVVVGIEPLAVALLVLEQFPEFHGVGWNRHGGTIHLDLRELPEGQETAKWMYGAGGEILAWA